MYMSNNGKKISQIPQSENEVIRIDECFLL